MSHGVSNVVMPETATAIEYSNGSVAPVESPTAAIINENSPICDKHMPHFTEVCTLRPVSKQPIVTENSLPNTTADRNADGFITLLEMFQDREDAFLGKDLNGDGVLNLEEVAHSVAKKQKRGHQPRKERGLSPSKRQ